MEIQALDALVLFVVIPHQHRRPDVTSTCRHGMRDADLCQTSGSYSDAAKVSGIVGYDAVSVVCVVLEVSRVTHDVIVRET